MKTREELAAQYSDYTKDELSTTLPGIEGSLKDNERRLEVYVAMRPFNHEAGNEEYGEFLQAMIEQDQTELEIVQARLAE